MKEFQVEHTAIPTELVQAPPPRVIEQREIAEALNACVGRQLVPALSGMLVLYVFFLFNQALVEKTLTLNSPAGLLAEITLGTLLFLRVLLRFVTLPPPWTHPVAFFVFGLLLANVFIPDPLGVDPFHSVYLVLLLTGASCLFLSAPWFSAALLASLSAWLYFVLTAPNREIWIRYGFCVLATAVLTTVIHAVRVLSYSRQAFLDAHAADGNKHLTEAVTITKQSEDRFRRLSQATIEGIVVHLKGRIVDANEAMAAMFGYKLEALIGREVVDLLSQEARASISESLVLGNFKVFETVGIRQNGARFPIEVFNNPVAQGDGGMVMAIRDITERKESEQILASETMRLQQQFKRQSALAGFELAVDQPSELFPLLQRIADAATELLPCSGGVSIVLRESTTEEFLVAASTIPGHSPLTLLPPECCGPNSLMGWIFENKESIFMADIAADPLGVAQMFPNQPLVAYAALPLLSDDRLLGVFLLLECEARTYKPEDHDFLKTLASRSGLVVAKVQLYERLRNANQLLEQQSAILQRNNVEMAQANQIADNARIILEREQAELEFKNIELARAKEAADVASRAKTEFLANISHELTTPLNGILGMASLLQSAGLNEEQADYLMTLNTSAEHLLSLINDILDYTKMETGQFALDPAEFDLDALVEQTIKDSAPKALAKGLELVLCQDASLPMRAIGDARRLAQIIQKILDNAIKFTEQGEVVVTVTWRSEAADSMLLSFEIKDTGIGLSAETSSKLFGAFEQQDGSDTRSFAGAGMGLAFCKDLVRLMGGQIGVESIVGQGSTFRFTISLLRAAAGRGTECSAPSLAVNTGLILIVDDNAASRHALTQYLQSRQCRVLSASGGEEAEAVYRESLLTNSPVTLVLADHHMPGVDGLRLAESIGKLASSRRPQYILMTEGPPPAGGELARAGVDYCLSKPILPSRLMEALLAGDHKKIVF